MPFLYNSMLSTDVDREANYFSLSLRCNIDWNSYCSQVMNVRNYLITKTMTDN